MTAHTRRPPPGCRPAQQLLQDPQGKVHRTERHCWHGRFASPALALPPAGERRGRRRADGASQISRTPSTSLHLTATGFAALSLRIRSEHGQSSCCCTWRPEPHSCCLGRPCASSTDRDTALRFDNVTCTAHRGDDAARCCCYVRQSGACGVKRKAHSFMPGDAPGARVFCHLHDVARLEGVLALVVLRFRLHH